MGISFCRGGDGGGGGDGEDVLRVTRMVNNFGGREGAV